MTILRWLLIGLALSGGMPPAARAQDPGAPCGRDENGYPYPCRRPDPAANFEAACIARADPSTCVPYHQRYCQVNGFPQACRLFQMGQNCFGGDPAVCQMYVSLLQANRACQLDRDPSACQWLQQQGY